MTSGIVFDIKDFTLHDGPGVRLTVFLKGCPLRCSWCHNPEGQSSEPQIIASRAGRRLAGRTYQAQELADIINRQADVLAFNGGGVTFSGGEPLMQARFLIDVISRLRGIHVMVETSGLANADDFTGVAKLCDLVYFDLKIMDGSLHRRFTCMDNDLILHNLDLLSGLGVPYVIRVPLIPGVTDTPANLTAIAALAKGQQNLREIHLMPYNTVAGGKYAAAGMMYRPGFDESRPARPDMSIFADVGVPVKLL